MKRIGNLYERIISVENLRLADEKARRGKHRTYGVRCHDRNREANILALHDALLTKTFKTSPYEVFKVHKPKERLIYRLPYYPDRIVHHAIMNILEPIWVAVFTHNTFSCVKGRGIEGCARSVERHIAKYRGRPLYILKIDLKKFYPSIPHATLKKTVRWKIKDKDLLWLIDEIIDSVNGTPHPVREGEICQGESLPIGNYLSQYLANLVLAPFMHRVNEEWGMDADEYADDFAFYSDSKDRLRELFHAKIRPYLEEELGLKVKDNWQIFPIAKNRFDRHGRALDFVGYKFYREQKLMRKGIKQNFCRAVARLDKRKRPLSALEYRQRIAPWLGWVQHSNSRHLLKKLILNSKFKIAMKASYDRKPSALEAVGNGSWLYRFNIEEKTAVAIAEGTEEPNEDKTRWDCDEVTVWEPLTANKITEAAISSICPASREQKLVNEYNAASLGMVGGSKTSEEAKAKIAAYREFLERRASLKEMVDSDCERLGIN